MKRRQAFTLVELLIVLAIIGLLAALLFPAFNRAREGGYQANCAASMKQIFMAVQQYRADEKYYPASLAVLLPNDFSLGDQAGATTAANTDGTGFFAGGRDALLCPDDDTDNTVPRSSYGDISIDVNAGPTTDMSRYVWNYYGYKKDNTVGTCDASDARGCAGTAFLTEADAATAGNADNSLLVTPTVTTYNVKTNPIKYSLSNRFAPTSTIITHCVFHRLPTAKGKIAGPYEALTDAEAGQLARDIILRLDGSARPLDISGFIGNGNWQKQNF